MSSNGFESVRESVVRMRSLVNVAKTLDNVEMQLVLNSEVLRAMTCTYRLAASAVTRHRDTLWWQLDQELSRVVASLAVLQDSREVPDRLALAQRQWQSASGNAGDLALRIGKLEAEDTGWAGLARRGKSGAVERQRVATGEFAEKLQDMGTVARQGQLLMESVFSIADVNVRSSNAQLDGFVHRAPSSSVGLWGLFSRSNGAVTRVRATAAFLATHVSRAAPWRITASELSRRLDQVVADGVELSAAGWPGPVARA